MSNLEQTVSIAVLTIVLGLACFSSASEASDTEQQIDSKPLYEVAVTFLNSYIDFLNDRSLEMGSVKWVQAQPTVTASFKSDLASFTKEAEFLDFDPILDAQDYFVAQANASVDGNRFKHAVQLSVVNRDKRLHLNCCRANG